MAYNSKNKDAEVNSRRLPMVFLLDVSGSMLSGTPSRNRLTLLNEMLVDVVRKCIDVAKVRRVAEVSFMLFTDEVLLESEFRNIRWMEENMLPPRKDRHPRCGKITWKTVQPEADANYDKSFQVPQFGISKEDGGTNIGYALKRAVRKLENRVKELKEFGSYPPFLILVSDGHPYEDNNPGYHEELDDQEEAIELLRSHTITHRNENNLIFPFVIGVGQEDINKKRLADYAQNFRAGYFHIRDNADKEKWDYLTQILARSITDSVTLNAFEFFDEIAEEAKKWESKQGAI